MTAPPAPLATALAAAGWQLLERAGEGAAATVWRARRADGREAAVKLGKDGALALHEADLVARVGRRWGPEVLDAGRTAAGVFVALAWTEGEVLGTKRVASAAARQVLAATVAHGVGRALAELHAAGVRHGDVKPANVLLSRERPTVDVPAARGATLIDLSAAADVGEGLRGATPKYLAPEVKEGHEPGPAADVYALGVVLAELLAGAGGEGALWAEAMTALAPGARPSAAWVADRAARALGLTVDAAEEERARVAMVRRAYLGVRAPDIRAAAEPGTAVGEPARAWLDEACAWQRKLGRGGAGTISPLGALARARWLVALVGPSAAAWPMTAGEDEGTLAARLVALAEKVPLAAWTRDEVEGKPSTTLRREMPTGDDAWPWLARELARPIPDAAAMALAEDAVATRRAPRTVVLEAARALSRRGDIGRAWAVASALDDDEALALRAELARRRGDLDVAASLAERASATAIAARIAWDRGDDERARVLSESAPGAAGAEVRGLVAYRKGAFDVGIRGVTEALAETREVDERARLEATLGMLEHARGDAHASLAAYGRAVELATRAGAVLEEAAFLTGESAAATDAGRMDRALASATRAALLWEKLGRPGFVARAWLARAGALAAIGAGHAACEAALEAQRRADETKDVRAHAYARWAIAESRAPGDPRAREEALLADRALRELAGGAAEDEDCVRAAARLLVFAPDAVDAARVGACDATAPGLGAAARWEWWGARAAAIGAGVHAVGADVVLAALRATVDIPAPLGSRGPALDAAVRLAESLGDGDAARRFEVLRQAAARTLRDGTPPEHVSSLASVPWARASALQPGVELLPAQVAQLDAIVRALASRDRLRPLLEQVLDAMVLWTGVERGLLLLRAPDGRLVPRAARNLARRDLSGEQLALSQGIARRAIETGDAVVATDAYAQIGDLHASVHALRLRSVLAVPLVARGETLGVVYLDERARRGAFGARELAWVRLVASQAAAAIADARDQVLLRRALRREARARALVSRMLAERDAELDATRAELQATRGDDTRFPYDAIVGRSAPVRELLRLADRVTASDVPVLLVGESGTGKELVARAIHANGGRARRAFVSENCAAVPEPLLESTLFGHVKGAFTGATATRAGLFDVADGGTLFLDEIGEMSAGMQTKLLRVLQDGEVRAVGAERSRRVDVRLLAATHRDLAAMVAAGTFREDLFYRLDVVQLRVPPLRERVEDIPLLVTHLLARHAPGGAVKVTRAAMDRLVRFPWPGNVRQLENEIRRAVVLAEGTIDVSDLSPDVARGGPGAARGAGLDLRARVDALEAELLREAIGKTAGNQTRAAELLGVSRFGLQKMMKRLGVKA